MRNLIIFFTVVLFSVNGIAQSYKIGVFAEPTVGWFKPQSRKVQTEASALGFGAGVVFDYYFADNYAFSSGLGLSMQGGDLHYEDSIMVHVYDETVQSPSDFVFKYRLNYFNIPLGLKLKTNQIGYFTYFFDLGFDLQVNLSAKGISDKKFYFSDETRHLDNDDITKDINFMNISYHFGGGLEYEISENTAFFAGLIYRNGFTDITAQKYTINSRVIALRLGIMF